MHKKFQVNRTKIKGGCQSETKAAHKHSCIDLTLIFSKAGKLFVILQYLADAFCENKTTAMPSRKKKTETCFSLFFSRITRKLQACKNLTALTVEIVSEFLFLQEQLWKLQALICIEDLLSALRCGPRRAWLCVAGDCVTAQH